MKRIYMAPKSTVFLLNTKQHLLSVSGRATGTSMGFGDNAGAEDVAGSRRGSSFWDDDDDY